MTGINSQQQQQHQAPKRTAWAQHTTAQHLQEGVGGYNSDGDVHRVSRSTRTKKSSYDAPFNVGSYEKPSGFVGFEKGHRRVRSGDAPSMGINTGGMHYGGGVGGSFTSLASEEEHQLERESSSTRDCTQCRYTTALYSFCKLLAKRNNT